MSGLVYPNFLAGKMLTQRRTPTWSTKPQRALSGKESRISYRAYPLYEWELQYEFLNDNTARVNYVPWSQDFTQWGVSNGGVGISPVIVGNWFGSAAPDGTYTADRVILNVNAGTTSSDWSQIYPSGTGSLGVTTTSVFAKTNDGTTRTVRMASFGSPIYMVVTPTWQRFSVVTNNSSNAGLLNIEIVGDGTTSKYADLSLWGAQFELGSLATYPYIATFGGAIITSDLQTITGFFNRMMGQYDTFLYQDPDFNTVTQQGFATGNGTTTAFNLTVTYAPSNTFGLPGGALAGQPEWVQNTLGAPAIYTNRYGEPELLSSAGRTNLSLQSNFAASWGVSGTGFAFATNAATAPDGTTTAAKFTFGSATSQYIAQLAQTMTNGVRYTFSVWLKENTQQYVGLTLDGDSSATDSLNVVFDLLNGVVGTVGPGTNGSMSQADAQMVAFPNGWYRCSISGQLPAADTQVRLGIVGYSSMVAGFYPTMTATGQSFFLWGAQLETGTQPTALIPTTTTHVTVGADYSLTGLSTFGDVETFQQVSFAAAPANTVPLTWSGTFLYRVRFSEDKNDFKEQYGRRIWTLDKLALEQIFL
jgi:hypothetical protein